MSAKKRIKLGCMTMVLAGVTVGMTGVIHAQQAPTPHSSAPQGMSAASAPGASATSVPAHMPVAASATASSAAMSASAPASASAASGASAPSAQKHGKSTTVRSELEAKVITIDTHAGLMVARGDDGIDRNFVLDAQARQSVAKIKAGERVKVLFDRSIRVTLKADGEKANPGIKDSGFDATVVSLNKPAHMVAIKGPKGNVFDIDVERSEMLDAIQQGSVVHVEFGRPLALLVTRV